MENEERQIFEIEKITLDENRLFYSFVKRFFDIFLSLCGIILLGIPMLVIAAVVRHDSEGPAIYKQERLGKDGKPFNCLKFRSMRIDAEKDGAKWAAKDDDRVTGVGRKLRNSRMDELPQLFNIFVGQMSFVGPRPERAVFYEKFEEYIHGFSQRLMVVPGLTGWAQINGGYDLRPEEKIIFDVEYIKNRSFSLDFKCILKTLETIFTHEGAR